MLNLDPEKLLMIGILALIVLGPHRLPDAARTLGRVIAQVRRMSGSVQGELRSALAEPRQALQHAVDEFGIDEVRSSMTSMTDTFRPQPTSRPPSVPLPAAQAALAQAASAVPPSPPPVTAVATTPPAPDDPSLN